MRKTGFFHIALRDPGLTGLVAGEVADLFMRQFTAGYFSVTMRTFAGLAQSVEHLIRNQGVARSSPVASTNPALNSINYTKINSLLMPVIFASKLQKTIYIFTTDGQISR